MQKENFSESAPRCNGVHLQGEELVRLGMHYISNERVVTGLPRTGFFGSTASLTKEKTRRVGGANTESLCASNKVQKPLTVRVERVYSLLLNSLGLFHSAPWRRLIADGGGFRGPFFMACNSKEIGRETAKKKHPELH